MPYGRRYYRRKIVNRDKYSVEQTAGSIELGEDVSDGVVDVVPSADLQGMRKVKHLTVSMGTTGAAGHSVLYWALVYVPNGTLPNTITPAGHSMYEPNQFVMNCGIVDFDAGPVRISSPVSRNLNSGDKICLVIKSTNPALVGLYQYVVKYAVTLQ